MREKKDGPYDEGPSFFLGEQPSQSTRRSTHIVGEVSILNLSVTAVRVCRFGDKFRKKGTAFFKAAPSSAVLAQPPILARWSK